MAMGSYLLFNKDNMIKYDYSLDHQKNMGKLVTSTPHTDIMTKAKIRASNARSIDYTGEAFRVFNRYQATHNMITIVRGMPSSK